VAKKTEEWIDRQSCTKGLVTRLSMAMYSFDSLKSTTTDPPFLIQEGFTLPVATAANLLTNVRADFSAYISQYRYIIKTLKNNLSKSTL
jgi:hypothetical protein